MNKIEIVFYQFTSTPLISSLPGLVKKIYETGSKLLIVCRNAEEMNQFDRALWTFSQKDFIPHCIEHEIHLQPENSPILLALDTDNNKNGAEVILNLSCSSIPLNYKKCLYACFGSNEECQDFLVLHDNYKSNTNVKPLTFWRQEINGKWIKLDQTMTTSTI